PKDWLGCEKSFLLPSRSCEAGRKIIARAGRRSSEENGRNLSRTAFRNNFDDLISKGADNCLPLYCFAKLSSSSTKNGFEPSRFCAFATPGSRLAQRSQASTAESGLKQQVPDPRLMLPFTPLKHCWERDKILFAAAR